ncbi:MAG: hypothetical protein LWW93_06580 [Hyphomicrobiales bacterium]|nr:hypothetical protein [Hyphomicrobiales bacterium]
MSGIDSAEDGGDRMVFTNRFPVAIRIVLAVIGAMTFLAPWELLIRPGHPFQWAMIPFWIISLGALSVGLPVLVAALVGLETTMTIDFERRRFVETAAGAFGLRFSRARDFSALVDLSVEEDTFSDGPSSWDVIARFSVPAGRKPWTIRSLASEPAAEALRVEIRSRMERAAV